jgi:hypothetical protein
MLSQQATAAVAVLLLVYLFILRPVAPPSGSNDEVSALKSQITHLRAKEALAKIALDEANLIKESEMLRDANPTAAPAAFVPAASVPSLPPSSSSPPPPSVPTPPVPAAPEPESAAPNKYHYLKSQNADPDAPREKITLMLYNQFKGFTDWWREEDFMGPARAECSTECTVRLVGGPELATMQRFANTHAPSAGDSRRARERECSRSG